MLPQRKISRQLQKILDKTLLLGERVEWCEQLRKPARPSLFLPVLYLCIAPFLMVLLRHLLTSLAVWGAAIFDDETIFQLTEAVLRLLVLGILGPVFCLMLWPVISAYRTLYVLTDRRAIAIKIENKRAIFASKYVVISRTGGTFENIFSVWLQNIDRTSRIEKRNGRGCLEIVAKTVQGPQVEATNVGDLGFFRLSSMESFKHLLDRLIEGNEFPSRTSLGNHQEILDAHRAAIERELERDESIAGIEMPSAKLFTPRAIAILALGTFLVGVSIIPTSNWLADSASSAILFLAFVPETVRGWLVLPLLSVGSLHLLIFLLPLFASTALLLYPIQQWQKLQRTVYVVTEKRAIAISGTGPIAIASYEPQHLSGLTLKKHRDGTGDILLAARATAKLTFKNISNPKYVEDCLRYLRQESQNAS